METIDIPFPQQWYEGKDGNEHKIKQKKISTGAEKPMPTTTSLKSLKSLKDINIDKDKKETTLRRSFRILSNHQNQRWSKH